MIIQHPPFCFSLADPGSCVAAAAARNVGASLVPVLDDATEEVMRLFLKDED